MNYNIVFQVIDWSQEKPSWANSKIVYTLKNVSEGTDVTTLVDAISTVLNKCTVRYTRLTLEEPITLERVNAHSGEYYQSR